MIIIILLLLIEPSALNAGAQAFVQLTHLQGLQLHHLTFLKELHKQIDEQGLQRRACTIKKNTEATEEKKILTLRSDSEDEQSFKLVLCSDFMS